MDSSIGVIFDMDGVLVDSNPDHKKAIHSFCKKYNHTVSESFLENRLYGRTNKEWIPELFGDINPQKLKELADEKEQLFRDIFTPDDHVVPGLLAFLNKLKDGGVPMAVATSAPQENADYILSRLVIHDYFDAVLHSAHVSKGKPHPEVYLKAAKALNKRPQDCIILEDSVSGIQAALNAGAKVLGVMTTHTAEELSGCHLLINDFNDLSVEDLVAL